MIQAAIITVGDELLNGDTTDTNSVFLARQLSVLGVRVLRKITVTDNESELLSALEQARRSVSLVLLTGGLGPTRDDRTKAVLGRFWGLERVVTDTRMARHIAAFFAQRNQEILPVNERQAEVFEGVQVFFNRVGTAPGMGYKKGDCWFISMPGVPFEMQLMMEKEVLPFLQNLWRLSSGKIYSEYLLTYGIGESFLAEKIQDIEQQLPEKIQLAYLPDQAFVQLRLTATAYEAAADLLEYKTKIRERIAEYVVSEVRMDLLELIKKHLTAHRQTIATAESCTGGYLAYLLTKEAGASAYFKGSVVAYQDEIKERYLGVKASVLVRETAVSASVVRAMHRNLLRHMPAQWGIAVSGYLNQAHLDWDGHTDNKVFIALGTLSAPEVFCFQCITNQRSENLRQLTDFILYQLYALLRQDKKGAVAVKCSG